jgi:UDP-N-acetylglucosamine--N-acetylmuramyl-(pentapeptide) pyrophosphoryl-undecaprenol N-acetylglucosamine transferase
MMGLGGGLVVLAAGGTGGHLFPAEALAADLESRGCEITLFTDRRGAAFGAATDAVETRRISARPVSGGALARLAGVADLARGTIEAALLLRRLRPAVAVGFGGYASVPTMLAAAQARIPTVIHEQNAVLGRANRLLAARVSLIATSFTEVARVRASHRHKVTRTGNPVRPAIAALAGQPYPPTEPDLSLRLLVTGGSQGAGVFSTVVPEAVARLPEPLRTRLKISQQCRCKDLAQVCRAYRALGVEAELAPFFDDLPDRLAAAHLVVCRAGASTVAELTAAGRPAILVPYPFATDDHQTANACAVERGGGAWLIPQQTFTGAALAERLVSLFAAPASLIRAARAAREMGLPDASARLSAMVMGLVPDGDGCRAEPNPHPREEAA